MRSSPSKAKGSSAAEAQLAENSPNAYADKELKRCSAARKRGSVECARHPWIKANAAERTKRPADANRARHADGPIVPRLLAARAADRGAAGERLPTGSREAPVRAAACVSR